MDPIEANDFYFPINWKLCLENSLDYYHVSQVHQNSVNVHVDHLHYLKISTGTTFKPSIWHPTPGKWFDRACTPDYGLVILRNILSAQIPCLPQSGHQCTSIPSLNYAVFGQ